MKRPYTLPDKLPDEGNWDWCQRAVASVPASEFMVAIVDTLLEEEKRGKGPAWSTIGQLTGHGSGVSAAIVERFRIKP